MSIFKCKKCAVLESRLREAEMRLEKMRRVLESLAKYGWVQKYYIRMRSGIEVIARYDASETDTDIIIRKYPIKNWNDNEEVDYALRCAEELVEKLTEKI